MRIKIEVRPEIQNLNSLIEHLDCFPGIDRMDVIELLEWLSTKGYHHIEAKLRELAREAGYPV